LSSGTDGTLNLGGLDLKGHSPEVVLQRMVNIISGAVGDDATVWHGRMAVTVEYADSLNIQLLPALRGDDGHVHVPSSRHDGWSKINPLGFQEGLTKRNNECANKLVPTIKLAKAINGQLPKTQRLSGYHMDSLAIAAFRRYAGEMTTSAMLPFFSSARAS